MFLEMIIESKPKTWLMSFRGILSLKKHYDYNVINLACKRALDFKIYHYSTVKNICKNGLYLQDKENLNVINAHGFAADLKKYDLLCNNNPNLN